MLKMATAMKPVRQLFNAVPMLKTGFSEPLRMFSLEATVKGICHQSCRQGAIS
ncbi:MAG: hypothetical protein R3184_02335 [Aurantimonas coralicida]|nr:hypothetical protein [Aurantimonas coralicida]